MRLYKLLLRLFPASFRAEYGDEMCRVFARTLRDRGPGAWLPAVADVAANSVRIHADLLRQDLRWTFRGLQRSPGFAVTAVAVAALGMGATTAGFALLNHVLIRPLPFPRAGELVTLFQTEFERGTARTQVTPPNYEDWKAANRTFVSMGSYVPAQISINLSGHGEPSRLYAIMAEPGLFETLQVRPAVGRVYSGEEERDGTVVLLSHRIASMLFGDAATAIGRAVRLNLQSFDVIGVMPADFMFPNRDTDVWMPLRRNIGSVAWADRRNHILNVVGRLAPEVSKEQAVADLQLITDRLAKAYPAENADVGAEVIGLRDVMSAQSRMLVMAVFAAAFCLTLIACTNLANLMYARAAARRQELAVRLAIGAGGDRLVRQLFTECLVLATMGGTLGLGLAAASRPLMLLMVPASLPTGALPALDWRVFAFAAVLALGTSVVFGVGPALRSTRTSSFQALRSRVIPGGRDRLRLNLVVAEVAATTVLLVATGLLLKAMWRVQNVDPGFDPKGVLTMRTMLPTTTPAAVRREFYARVLTESRALPGVTSAGYVSFLPMTFPAGNLVVTVPGLTAREEVRAHTRFVTPDYFKTMSIPLLRGRDVNERDVAGARPVAVISQSLAERLWPLQDPLGREFTLVRVSWTVVGVVGDVAVRGLEEPSLPQVYFPSDQLLPIGGIYAPNDFVLRAAGDPTTLAPALRDIVRRASPEQAVADVRLVDEIVAAQTSSRRAQLGVLSTFAAIAFVLAAIGIYGLLSFAVAMRTPEIGVRLALGAGRRDVVNMFVGQGLLLGAAGIAIGVPLAYAASQAMTALLFGVRPHDPWTYAGATVLAAAMIVAGSLRPAFRAASLDPAITIRGE